MRRLVKSVRSAASRSNVLSLILSVVLGAVAVYGFANQVVQDRNAAIQQAIQDERAQWVRLWQEIRDDQRAMRNDLKDVSDDVKTLGRDVAVLRAQVSRQRS